VQRCFYDRRYESGQIGFGQPFFPEALQADKTDPLNGVIALNRALHVHTGKNLSHLSAKCAASEHFRRSE
jgi:hypothetical protein